jgi:peptide-methionine (R)-S-oxide reductase
MDRRHFLARALGGIAGAAVVGHVTPGHAQGPTIPKLVRSNAEWKKLLTPAQYHVLREEGTERPFSSPLNDEKRKGTFACAGCDLPLFESRTKYDSGTGWPSFYDHIPGNVATKIDFKLIYPRTEYHCARCGGHQGHVFEDGPKPTGLRYCNNGVALKFLPV